MFIENETNKQICDPGMDRTSLHQSFSMNI
jgi:hypothetical protein